MTLKGNMCLWCFGELKASEHVDTADFLCLQQSQLLHPSPSASFLPSWALLAFSTTDSDLPTGAALPWRRAVCSLELAVCSEAACNLIFRHAPPHPPLHSAASEACRHPKSLKYHRHLCLQRADNTIMFYIKMEIRCFETIWQHWCSMGETMVAEMGGGVAECGSARARARICLAQFQNQYVAVARGRGAKVWRFYDGGHFVS